MYISLINSFLLYLSATYTHLIMKYVNFFKRMINMPKNHKYIFLLESIIILLFFSGCLKNNTNELNEEILQNVSNQYKVNCPIVSAESVLDIKK